MSPTIGRNNFYRLYFCCALVLFTFVFPVFRAGAIDLTPDDDDEEEGAELGAEAGAAGEDKPLKVLIAGQPVQVKQVSGSEVLDIAQALFLKPEQEWNSDHFDVRGFSEVTVYVFPLSSAIVEDPPPSINYQIDAFFSLEKPSKDNHDKPSVLKRQEFGYTVIENSQELQRAVKLSTGPTSTMALYSKIYGPYLSVQLKNTSKEAAGKFRVAAYVTE